MIPGSISLLMGSLWLSISINSCSVVNLSKISLDERCMTILEPFFPPNIILENPTLSPTAMKYLSIDNESTLGQAKAQSSGSTRESLAGLDWVTRENEELKTEGVALFGALRKLLGTVDLKRPTLLAAEE